MLPRLIATDLDGTLLRTGGVLSDRTKAALALARSRGALVVPVTARPPRFIDWLGGYADAAICSNGAITYAPGTREVLAERSLEPAVTRKLVEAISVALPSAGCAVETGDLVYCLPSFTWRCGHDGPGIELEVPDVEAALGHAARISKLLVHAPDLTADAMLGPARAAAGHLAEITHSGGAGLLEISAPGVTKVSTLAAYSASLGLTAADVLAFGDGINDLGMLSWAGTAYTMANAHPEVQAAGHQRTASNNDDGVALVLERIYE
ncbi:HAD family hydrolase [Longispora albida]|uniref:HAD family hydrolase n=1 Tax=Longispora albida TaxID=203523 RepID=UPI000382B09A|nr:HAD family hydrolase [Longispora albida]